MADIKIYGAIRSMTGDGKSAYSGQVWDEALQKFQSQINIKAESSLQQVTEEQFNAIFD